MAVETTASTPVASGTAATPANSAAAVAPVAAAKPDPVLDGPQPVAASASTAPAVPLAGVPVTPMSEAGGSAAGPAVPSSDSYLTEASPNKDTSSPTPAPEGLTAEASGK